MPLKTLANTWSNRSISPSSFTKVARRRYAAALEKDEKDEANRGRAVYRMGALHFYEGEYAEAVPWLDKACKLKSRRKDFQCLRVREIRYGDNGVKTSTGEWENFYSEIEGYKHEPGIRNVLRIQRYKRQNVPADASAYAYVLDMVVESERVGR